MQGRPEFRQPHPACAPKARAPAPSPSPFRGFAQRLGCG